MRRRAARAPALRFERVFKSYGRRRALAGPSFEVAAGGSLALAGPNGAGKTTCMKALLDFCDLDSGTIEIFGVPHREPRARAPLAFLPERFQPPHALRGRDFLRCMARLQGVPYHEERALGICADLDLDPRALAGPARDCSKGTAQKLGLAASFLSGRALLVLDEPMSGLDPGARRLVRRLLARHRAGGGSLLLSTHLLADLHELCERVAILHEGTLRFAGPVEECLRRFGTGSLEEAYLHCVGAGPARPRRTRTPDPARRIGMP